ncbi:hypothetical protein HIM_06259 [Hirsutella minnesotensis 3608]|uniref:MHYT domain-containing protein n=1 Tax=Hirsutella minnesotensis 3608 TaxID=1043627 RepID=A0A0F7ZU51_9HYPO|nr:hypothetical protein HIM_06259 [Hirsutella minnesotensis 3608]
MPSTQDLLDQYSDQLVPFSFHAGFVCLSYAISLLGTGSTLELMRRRTSHRGLHNLLLLVGAAISMGGIAIWSMHFIGNRAIYIFDGREDMQISYSTGMTILSLLVPILVLILAFLAVSVNGRIRWWRIGIAGLLSGGAICGMHYLADASISNFQTTYEIGYVVGAAIIAVSASTTALAIFFVFEAAWKVLWWKRLGCAMVLAGAVSGMHWCAAVGTSYRLIRLQSLRQGMSRHSLSIMVICLSVAACIVLTISGIYSSWIRRDYASKSQKVVLAAAVFDEEGRIMVNQEGFLPSEVVTDMLMTKSHSEIFDTSHPLFHWMYRASRNWPSIASLTDKMASHIGHVAQDRYNGRARLKLVNEDGTLVQHYDQLICELFSLAALALANKTKEVLTSAGTLWEEIFVTGNTANNDVFSKLDDSSLAAKAGFSKNAKAVKDKSVFVNLAEKGLIPMHQQYGRGCLMFLVRHINARKDLDKLEAAGYRFAEVHHVVGTIRSSMQISTPDFATRLRSMSANPKRGATLAPGVHLGIFAVRARLDHCGFDVLVQKDAKNLLPTAEIPLERLEPWQVDFVNRLRGLGPLAIIERLNSDHRLSPQEARLASHLRNAIATLRSSLGNLAFSDATLMSQVVHAPCTTREENPRLSTCSLISFRMILPIHSVARLPQCEFVPLSFFRVQQQVYAESPYHLEFAHMVHRDLSSLLHNIPSSTPPKTPQRSSTRRSPGWINRLRSERSPSKVVSLQLSARSQERLSTGTFNPMSPYPQSDSMSFDDCRKPQFGNIAPSPMGHVSCMRAPSPVNSSSINQDKQLFGGIMVSQQIMVDVQELPNERIPSNASRPEDVGSPETPVYQDAKDPPRQGNGFSAVAVGENGSAAARDQGGLRFIDDLLSLCMERSEF